MSSQLGLPQGAPGDPEMLFLWVLCGPQLSVSRRTPNGRAFFEGTWFLVVFKANQKDNHHVGVPLKKTDRKGACQLLLLERDMGFFHVLMEVISLFQGES